MFNLIERLSSFSRNYDLSKVKDFPDLKERYLKQKIRKINNKDERWKIWQAFVWLNHQGVKNYLDNIGGIEYLGKNDGIDCVQYAIGNARIQEIVQGTLKHDGNPKTGEIIIYSHKLFTIYGWELFPQHIGVVQEGGTIKSKWGDNGPIMKHRWDQIIPDYGNYAFFSKFRD